MMEELLTYILKSAGLLTIFFLSYQLLLRKDTSFSLNRKFLVGGIFTSFLLPAIYFTRKVLIEAPVVNSEFSPEMFQNTPLVREAEINWWNLAGIIYLVGAGLLLCQFAFRLFSILKLIKTRHSENAEGFKFIKFNRITGPFSFFSYIVYNPASHSQHDLKLILQHEKVHAAQLHSVDIILANLTTAILWFNPFSWWYKRSIEQNLEFLADRETVAAAGSRKAYQHALIKVSVPEFQPALTNHFYQSFIKKRIVMLNKNQNNKPKMWKVSLVLPLLIAFMLFFNVKTEAQIVQKEDNSSEKTGNTNALTTSKSQKNEEEPLYILNGVPSKKAVIDSISPENIKEISVIKEGNATAIYGSSAQHGVILISTKTRQESDISHKYKPNKKEYVKNILGSIDPSRDMIILIDGEVQNDNLHINSINPETISEMEVLKGEEVISKFGEKAKDGVINVVLKDSEKNSSSEAKAIRIRKQENSSIYGTGKKAGDINASENGEQEKNVQRNIVQEKPLVVLNGKVMPETYNYDDLDPSEIASINVLKGATATEKYGDKGKNGVVEIFKKGYTGETAVKNHDDKEKNEVEEIHISGYGGVTESPVNTTHWYINSTYSDEALNKIKAVLKEKKQLKVNFSNIQRDKEGLITSIIINAEGKDGKKASASFSQSGGIPHVVIGQLENGTILISSKQ